LTPICTKSFVGWGFAPDPTGKVRALHRPIAVFRGLILQGVEGRGREGEERRGKRRGG